MTEIATSKPAPVDTSPVVIMPDHFCDLFSQFVCNKNKLSFVPKELHSCGEALVEFEKSLYAIAKSLCFASKNIKWDVCELASVTHGFFMQPATRENFVITDDNNYVGYNVDRNVFGLIVSLKSFQYLTKYFAIKDFQQSRIFEYHYDTLLTEFRAFAAHMLLDADKIVTDEEKVQIREMCRIVDRFVTL